MPAAKFKSAKPIPSEGRGPIVSALVTDQDGIQYLVRKAKNAKGNLQLATEAQAVRAIRSAGTLPFKVPTLVADATTPEGQTLHVLEFVYGSIIELDALRISDPILRSLGHAISAVHGLNTDRIRQAGVPEYSANDVRENRIAELDRAASTGKVPASLLQRWESALEDLDLFRFNTTVVHGNIATGNALELDGEVSGLIGWSNLHIGDPAEDFVTFAANIDHDVLDSVRFTYLEKHADADANLSQRATLYSELAIANYLVASISNNNMDEADWAVAELETIAASVTDGSARALGRVSYSTLQPIVAEEELETLVVAEPNVIIAEVNDTIDVSDLKTRPIELPNTSDDQLF